MIKPKWTINPRVLAPNALKSIWGGKGTDQESLITYPEILPLPLGLPVKPEHKNVLPDNKKPWVPKLRPVSSSLGNIG